MDAAATTKQQDARRRRAEKAAEAKRVRDEERAEADLLKLEENRQKLERAFRSRADELGLTLEEYKNECIPQQVARSLQQAQMFSRHRGGKPLPILGANDGPIMLRGATWFDYGIETAPLVERIAENIWARLTRMDAQLARVDFVDADGVMYDPIPDGISITNRTTTLPSPPQDGVFHVVMGLETYDITYNDRLVLQLVGRMQQRVKRYFGPPEAPRSTGPVQ